MSQRSKASMKAYKDVQLPTGSTPIRSSAHRAVLEDLIDSVQFLDSDTDTRYYEHFDWVCSSSNYPLGWAQSVSGTGAAIAFDSSGGVNSTENAFGVVQIETGTQSSGYARLRKGTSMLFGTHAITLKMRIALGTLSDGTDTFAANIGFWDGASGDFSDAAYFTYTHGTNSGNWQCITANGGSTTTSNTSVAGATTYSVFEIIISQDGATVTFKINGVEVASHTTNIPNTAVCGMVSSITKSAGTTSRFIYQDWYSLLITRSTAR